MSTITVATTTTAIPYQGTATTLQLRISAGSSFITSAGTVVPASPLIYKTVTCTIAAGIVTIPAFTIDSTTDSLTNQNARYSLAALYESSTATTPVFVMLDNFAVTHTYTSTDWTTLTNQRTASNTRRAEGSYTASQTDTLINSRLANYYTATEIDDLLDDVMDLSDYAVRFDASKSHNVCHGLVHLPATNYTNCFFQAWIQPEGGQYIYSSGYGGGHTLLYGITGDTSGYTLTGNFYDMGGATNISFATTDKLRHGEPVHVALAYDGTQIVCIINGVPSSITAYTGVRNVTAITDAVGFVGGSDHQNFTGLIWGWQLFEADLPSTNFHSTTFRPDIDSLQRPKLWDGSALRTAHASVDYRRRQLQDNSGNAYHGFFTESTNQGNTLTGVSAHLSLSAGVNRVPANAPTWEQKAFAYTGAATPEAVPTGAAIFDSFGRADIHKGNYTTGSSTTYVFALGSTEAGSKTWAGSTKYGILNGNVYSVDTTPGVAYVTDSTANREIRLTKPNTGFVTGYGVSYRLVFNYVDANNYNFIDVDEYGTGRVYEKVSGTPTQVGGNLAFGTGWTTLKAIITGGDKVAVYKDSSLIGDRTVTENLAGNGKGFELNHPIQRIKSFTVI